MREKLDSAGEKSIAWYESVAEKMALSPEELALDYMLRTGLMTPERLARESPNFIAKLAEKGKAPTI